VRGRRDDAWEHLLSDLKFEHYSKVLDHYHAATGLQPSHLNRPHQNVFTPLQSMLDQLVLKIISATVYNKHLSEYLRYKV